MFLTKEEMAELTGYDQFAFQRAWLTRRSWSFEISRTGRPVVARSYAEAKMGSHTQSVPTRRAPNFASIR